LVGSADVLLLAGRSTDTTALKYAGERLPHDATLVHVSDDAWEVGKNEPADVAVIGDPGRVLGSIADAVAERVDDAERERRLVRVRAAKDGAIGSDEEAPSDGPATKTQLARALRDAVEDPLVVNEAVSGGIALRRETEFEADEYLANKSADWGMVYRRPSVQPSRKRKSKAVEMWLDSSVTVPISTILRRCIAPLVTTWT